MATVTGLTAERMIAIENKTVVDGNVVGNNLILVTRDGTQIDAGSVLGPVGPAGPTFIVCTSTTRPAVGPTEQGKAIYETDTKLIRIWDGTRWKLQEKIVCTSTTRPAMVAADEGVKIYETDSNLEYTWTGTSWLLAASNIAVFIDQADRSTKWPSPPTGAVSYLASTPGTFWLFENGYWGTVGPPPGSCSTWIGTNAPLNWTLMFGQTIVGAQTLYPLLWNNVDPTWKSGANILVPDLRGRIPIGKDNMGGVASGRISPQGKAFHGVDGLIIGSAGGNEWMQSHNHGINDPWHAHWSAGAAGPAGVFGGFYSGQDAWNSVTAMAPTGITIQNTGQGGAQNIQPSIILNWILKVL